MLNNYGGLQKTSSHIGIANRTPQSMVKTEGIESITKHEYTIGKQHREGQLRSLELQILDNKVEGKAWDLLSSEEKVEQRKLNYETEVTKTQTFGVKKEVAGVNLDMAETRLSIAQEKYFQANDKLLGEQARTVQQRELMTIKGNETKILIDKAKLDLAQLQAELTSSYKVDFNIVDNNVIDTDWAKV